MWSNANMGVGGGGGGEGGGWESGVSFSKNKLQ